MSVYNTELIKTGLDLNLAVTNEVLDVAKLFVPAVVFMSATLVPILCMNYPASYTEEELKEKTK